MVFGDGGGGLSKVFFCADVGVEVGTGGFVQRRAVLAKGVGVEVGGSSLLMVLALGREYWLQWWIGSGSLCQC